MMGEGEGGETSNINHGDLALVWIGGVLADLLSEAVPVDVLVERLEGHLARLVWWD